MMSLNKFIFSCKCSQSFNIFFPKLINIISNIVINMEQYVQLAWYII